MASVTRYIPKWKMLAARTAEAKRYLDICGPTMEPDNKTKPGVVYTGLLKS